MDENKALVVFQDKKIRRIWHNEEWWFSVVDVIAALTDSADAKDYWYHLKKREAESSGIELSTFCRQLKLPSADGKQYQTDCANTEGLFRIIGYDRVKEIENPELAQKRIQEYLVRDGYSLLKVPLLNEFTITDAGRTMRL
ncbi:Bro-N domain-containing protein [Candidatus Woesearchaeota archaeon]|nr:Bro-N domain-containing protein [Candidatus Woesearchaeota archaeon]